MRDYSLIKYKSNRLTIAKNDIIKIFESSDQKVYKIGEISNILSVNREFLRLSTKTTVDKFIAFLIYDIKKLKPVEFNFPFRKELRFVWGVIPFFEILLSLYQDSYFSHYSALFFNELTEQVPKTYYLNVEQKIKTSSKPTLSQNGIDLAFKNKPRISTNIINADNHKICLLNGKYTNNLGIQEQALSDGTRIRVTNIERTLIDIVVRPFYSGGIYEILKAYQKAASKVSINKLMAYLKELNYIYPYHQVIGFYLQKSGAYRKSQIDLLKSIDIKYNFYLANQILETDYSEEWRLFYPKGF